MGVTLGRTMHPGCQNGRSRSETKITDGWQKSGTIELAKSVSLKDVNDFQPESEWAGRPIHFQGSGATARWTPAQGLSAPLDGDNLRRERRLVLVGDPLRAWPISILRTLLTPGPEEKW